MNKRLPEYVCFNLIPKPTGNIIRLECFGENLPNKTAKKIMRKLFYLWVNQTKKGLNQEMNAQDVFPTVKKFIEQGSVTELEARKIALKYCSEYVYTSELERA